MQKWAFIYTSGDSGAIPLSASTGTKACELVTVGVPSTTIDDYVIDGLIAEGVELIECCGGFGPGEVARVIEQVAGRVPVGFVTYPGSEAAGLHSLFG